MPMGHGPPRGGLRAPTLRLPVLISGAVVGLAFLLHAFYLSVPAEDAFISYRFATHLANGHGLVWNVGAPPVEGYTNFLWVVLCALPLLVGLDVVLFSQIAGVAAGLASLWVTHRFARDLLDLPRGPALLACGMLAVSGPFAAWSASGMETGLFTLLVLTGCLGFAGWLRSGDGRSLALAPPALLLATLTRPEGFAVFVLLGGLGALLCPAPERRRLGLALLAYALPFLAYFAWRYGYFGFPLPNTFYAKTGNTLPQYLRGLQYVFVFVLHFAVPLLPVLFTLGLEHARTHAPGRSGDLAGRLRSRASEVVLVSLIAMYTAYITYVGGDYMAMYRFFVPILPALYLLFAAATHHWVGAVVDARSRRRLTGLLVGIAVGLTLLQSTPLEERIFHKPWFMHGTWRGIQTERWAVARFRLVADLFQQRKRKDDSIALRPVGVIPFLTGMPSHSFVAIVEPELAHQPSARRMGTGFPGHEKARLGHALSQRPTYLMFGRWLSQIALADEPARGWQEVSRQLGIYPDYTAEVGARLRAEYHLRSVWLDDRANGEAGYFNFLEARER